MVSVCMYATPPRQLGVAHASKQAGVPGRQVKEGKKGRGQGGSLCPRWAPGVGSSVGADKRGSSAIRLSAAASSF